MIPSKLSSPVATVDPERVVEEGYDRIADRYFEWSAEVLVEPEDRFDARFLWIVARVPAPAPS